MLVAALAAVTVGRSAAVRRCSAAGVSVWSSMLWLRSRMLLRSVALRPRRGVLLRRVVLHVRCRLLLRGVVMLHLRCRVRSIGSVGLRMAAVDRGQGGHMRGATELTERFADCRDLGPSVVDGRQEVPVLSGDEYVLALRGGEAPVPLVHHRELGGIGM